MSDDKQAVVCLQKRKKDQSRRVSPFRIYHQDVIVPVCRPVSAPQGGRTTLALQSPKGRPNEAGMTDATQGRVIGCGMTDSSHCPVQTQSSEGLAP